MGRHALTGVLALALATTMPIACGKPATTSSTTPVGNSGAGTPAFSATLTIDAAQSFGWLGLAPAPPSNGADAGLDAPYWAPHGVVSPAVVPGQDPKLADGTRVTVVPSRGAPVALVTGAPTKIQFGCDQNELEVVPLVTPATIDQNMPVRFPPGIVWILPVDAPKEWHPRALAVTPGPRRVDEARWSIGSLELVATKISRMKVALAVFANGTQLTRTQGEKYVMDGADDSPVDLSADGDPGVSFPIAAYEIVPGGPVLLVLFTPGYEGISIATRLVQASGTRETDASLGLYLCAF